MKTVGLFSAVTHVGLSLQSKDKMVVILYTLDEIQYFFLYAIKVFDQLFDHKHY